VTLSVRVKHVDRLSDGSRKIYVEKVHPQQALGRVGFTATVTLLEEEEEQGADHSPRGRDLESFADYCKDIKCKRYEPDSTNVIGGTLLSCAENWDFVCGDFKKTASFFNFNYNPAAKAPIEELIPLGGGRGGHRVQELLRLPR
jgi:hypothetical protein